MSLVHGSPFCGYCGRDGASGIHSTTRFNEGREVAFLAQLNSGGESVGSDIFVEDEERTIEDEHCGKDPAVLI